MKLLFKHNLILDICKGKKALHIGATDFPYHKNKSKNNELLHQKLEKVCSELIGMDINKESIAYLKNNSGISNIYYGDIYKEVYDAHLKKQDFEVIVFADVLEHLENPGIALSNLKKFMNKKTKLIITTPNVFSYSNIKTFFSGKEKVHPDHLFWPSYETTSQLLKRNRFKIKNFTYCFWGYKNRIKTRKGKIMYKLGVNFKCDLLPCLFFVVSL